MSDLSSLFNTPLPPHKFSTLSMPPSHQPPVSNLSVNSNRVKPPIQDTWDINELESSLRKGIKKKMESHSLDQEFKEFQKKQKEEVANGALLLTGSLFTFYFFIHIDSRILFHLCLFCLVHTLPSLPFKLVQQPILNGTLRFIKPVVYAALFYYILKKMAEADMSTLNFPLTFVAIIGTSIFICLDYFQKVFQLSVEDLRTKIVCQKKKSTKFILMGCLLYQKVKFILRIWKYLLYTAVIACSSLTVFSYILKINIITFFKPWNAILGILVFLGLQLFVEFNRFAFMIFNPELTVIRDKMPIILTLLRSQRTPLTRKIHQKCIQHLFRRVSRVPCFLSTQTCKSLVFDTYMELFTFYTHQQLKSLHQKVKTIMSSVQYNRKIFTSSKSMVQDIFIYFKKAKAYVVQFNEIVSLLNLLEEENYLIRTIVTADEHSFKEKESIKTTTKVSELLNMVRSKLLELKSQAITRGPILSELQIYEKKMESWLFSMRNGWVIE